MVMSPNRFAIAVAAVLAASSLAACSSSGTSSPGSTTGSTTGSATGPTTGSSSGAGGGGAISINIGTKKITFPAGTKPNIALVPAGTTLQYSKSLISGYQSE